MEIQIGDYPLPGNREDLKWVLYKAADRLIVKTNKEGHPSLGIFIGTEYRLL